MHLKFVAILGIILSISSTLPARQLKPDSLTVDQVIRAVLRHNPALKKAESGISAARARVEQSRSALFPGVSAEASYSRVGPVPELSVPGFGGFSLFPENNYDAHLSLHQLVYDFGRRGKRIELAKSGVKLNRDNLETLRTDLTYRAIIAFYSILFLRKNITVIQQEIDDLNRHQEVTQKKVQAGTAIEYDVLSTRVRAANAANQLEDARNSLEKQEILLRQLMGAPQDTLFHLKGDITTLALKTAEDSLLSLAEAQRPEYQRALDARFSARLQRDLAAKGRMPSLNLNLSYGVKNGYIPNLNALRGNWVAGMRLEVPLFEGFRIRYKKEEAEADYRAAGFQVEETRTRIDAEVRKALSDVKASRNKLQTTKLQLQQARDARKMARTQYDAGVISNLELLDAQTQLTQAQFIYLKAQFDYAIHQYLLKQAMGSRPWRPDF